MYCSHCGALISGNSPFCPSCGDKIVQEVPPKRFPWKKWLAILLFVMFLILAIFYIASKDLTESVEGQLKALRLNKVTEAYYSFTSKEFQGNTSLEKFREFIKHYPQFFKNQSIQFTSSSFDNNVLTLKGTLTSQEKETLDVEYKLIDEDGDWKILSIELVKPDHTLNQVLKQGDFWSMRLSSFVPSDKSGLKNLKNVVNEMLAALSTGKIKEAYKLTSKEFQLNTPLQLFESYIQEFPLLSKHDSVTFGESLVENEVGVIEVELQHAGKAMKVDYALKQEQGFWKIWGMQINQTVQKGELVSS